MKNIIAIYRRWNRRINLLLRRFKSEKILAVYDDDLIDLLAQMGLKEKIEKGDINCSSCGKRITFDNIGVIENSNDRVFFYCQSIECQKNKKNND